jgi:hypothetical protein
MLFQSYLVRVDIAFFTGPQVYFTFSYASWVHSLHTLTVLRTQIHFNTYPAFQFDPYLVN